VRPFLGDVVVVVFNKWFVFGMCSLAGQGFFDLRQPGRLLSGKSVACLECNNSGCITKMPYFAKMVWVSQ
jgi:hypothetical protein